MNVTSIKALIIFLYLLLAVCPGKTGPLSGMSEKLILDINSSGKRIEIRVGNEIQIELKAIGSTGYGWYIDKLDPDLFDLLGEEKKVLSGEDKSVVGTSVVSTWRLSAKKPGSTIVRMSYYRPWDGKDKAINRFEVSVDIVP